MRLRGSCCVHLINTNLIKKQTILIEFSTNIDLDDKFFNGLFFIFYLAMWIPGKGFYLHVILVEFPSLSLWISFLFWLFWTNCVVVIWDTSLRLWILVINGLELHKKPKKKKKNPFPSALISHVSNFFAKLLVYPLYLALCYARLSRPSALLVQPRLSLCCSISSIHLIFYDSFFGRFFHYFICSWCSYAYSVYPWFQCQLLIRSD